MFIEIYDSINWPLQPPYITNDLKESPKNRKRKKLCKNYYKKCWKLTNGNCLVK